MKMAPVLPEVLASGGGRRLLIMLTGVVSLQTLLQSYRWGAEYCVFKPLDDMQPLVSILIPSVIRKWARSREMSVSSSGMIW